MGGNSASLTVTPLADALVESPEAVLVNVAPGSGYSAGSPGSAVVLIEDYTQANGDGVFAQYFNNTSATVPNFSVAPSLSRVESQINGNWPGAISGGSPGPGVNGDYFASRWTAEVLPEFAQIYTFYANVNTGGRLWINGQLLVNNWARLHQRRIQRDDSTAGRPPLRARVRAFRKDRRLLCHRLMAERESAEAGHPAGAPFFECAAANPQCDRSSLLQNSGPYSIKLWRAAIRRATARRICPPAGRSTRPPG